MGHLDHRHARGVEGGDDGVHLLPGELVTLVVRAVPREVSVILTSQMCSFIASLR